MAAATQTKEAKTFLQQLDEAKKGPSMPPLKKQAALEKFFKSLYKQLISVKANQ